MWGGDVQSGLTLCSLLPGLSLDVSINSSAKVSGCGLVSSSRAHLTVSWHPHWWLLVCSVVDQWREKRWINRLVTELGLVLAFMRTLYSGSNTERGKRWAERGFLNTNPQLRSSISEMLSACFRGVAVVNSLSVRSCLITAQLPFLCVEWWSGSPSVWEGAHSRATLPSWLSCSKKLSV